MGSAPQTTVTAPTGKQLCTMDPATRAPRGVYKCNAVYLFTDLDPALTYELAKAEIASFFAFLNSVNLMPSEYVRLVNIQLVPMLQYHLMAHPLRQNQLKQLQSIIWTNVALHPDPEKGNRISRLVSEKDKYVPRKSGILGLRHFQHRLNISPVNSAIRYLNTEGREDTSKVFRQAALSTEEFLVHRPICNACHSLNLRLNSLNYENSTPLSLMHHHENVYVRSPTNTTNRVTKWGNKQRPPTTDLGIYRGSDGRYLRSSGFCLFSRKFAERLYSPSPNDIGPP